MSEKLASAPVENEVLAGFSQSFSSPKGLKISRYFTCNDHGVYDGIKWEKRTALITGENGNVVFEQKDVEFPDFWSQMAVNVVTQKYFRGKLGTPQRETSLRELINRVADSIADWGFYQHYFLTEHDADIFRNELKHLLVHQKMAFNSPVWFNVGIEKSPQVSACFINSVEDTMESILQLAKTEGMLFKYGSGTGTNFSTLRSSKEHLRGGGTSSGPISFMKGFDAFAGVIKSGGRTRRAAKMVILNADHPDILEFINCKASEEKKAWALIDAGYDGSFTGEAYGSVFFQNSNNSVRVTDEFMRAVIADGDWKTRSVTTGEVIETVKARAVWDQIAAAAWQCGDPGLQFDTTINNWHTSPSAGKINASNPCSEFMYLDDTACNLASLNLRKFQDLSGDFDCEAFESAVDTTILAQEILVGSSKYPTEKITENSRKFRPLGLGYANLGSLLMARGLPYDSEPGRAYAAAVTALMHGRACLMSAKISQEVTGPFEGYEGNREQYLHVMQMHREATKKIDKAYVPFDMKEAVENVWDEVISAGTKSGFRNGQLTVLAPTGTIGFMMDCDTTGIEPDIALVKYKRLVGGGMLKMVNGTVPEALARLGYDAKDKADILAHIERSDTIEHCMLLKDEHLPVFDCAFRPNNGTRSIHYMGHLKMMAAVQPFLSGAISKTVNMPSECTVEDVKNAYMESWRMGLKAVAVYRDGCKRSQPVSTNAKSNADGTTVTQKEEAKEVPPARRKLKDDRNSLTHRFSIGGHDGYVHVGMYDDGKPGEMFIRMSKEGSTIAGLMDSFAIAVSLCLQHGVPPQLLVDKFLHTKFEPSGWTENPDIKRTSSVLDYIFRWFNKKFVSDVQLEEEPEPQREDPRQLSLPPVASGKNGTSSKSSWKQELDAPICPACGSMTVRNGACHKCLNCGESLGCS